MVEWAIEWTEIKLVDDLVVRLVTSKLGLRAIRFRLSGPAAGQFSLAGQFKDGERNDANPVARETAGQLDAYFTGRLRRFDVTLDMQGTAFQQRVWRALEGIPYGETRTYRQIAEVIGAPRAVRAVGAANGANPIPIVVPCHRVIGTGGKLAGYGGGLPLKRRLLTLEGALPLAMEYEARP